MYSSVQSASVKAYVDLDLLSDMSDDELLQTLAQRPDSLHRVPHTGSKLLASTLIYLFQSLKCNLNLRFLSPITSEH